MVSSCAGTEVCSVSSHYISSSSGDNLTQYTTHLTISGTRKCVLINCRAEVSGCGVLLRRWSVLNNVWKNGECNMIMCVLNLLTS